MRYLASCVTPTLGAANVCRCKITSSTIRTTLRADGYGWTKNLTGDLTPSGRVRSEPEYQELPCVTSREEGGLVIYDYNEATSALLMDEWEGVRDQRMADGQCLVCGKVKA